MNYDGYSLADIAAATGNNNRNNNDGMFGDNWAWIIVLFLIFGWGNRGFGGYGNEGGNNGGGVMDAYVLNSDFATLSRQVDSGFDRIGNRIENVNNGLCSGFFDVARQFGTLNTTLCQEFGNIQNSITQNGYEGRLQGQQLASQLASCCCDIRQQISDCCCTTNRNIDAVNYNMAMNTNQLQNAMCNNTRDIVEAQNCGTRAILDAITANRIEDKNAQIQAQQNEINALRLAASQEKQNNYLIDQLKTKCAEPAYIVPNPNCCYNYSVNGFGYNNNCGCNNGCGNNF